MGNTSEPALQFHVAVRIKDCIVVVSRNDEDKKQQIWTYNLWTDQWKQCLIRVKRREFRKREDMFYSTEHMFGVEIRSIIYMFDELVDFTQLWKLIPLRDGVFQQRINYHDNPLKRPSPRGDRPCVWKYGDKMWMFGGYGESPFSFMNDHGDFERSTKLPSNFVRGFNNQLFCYDPSVETWENIACRGDVPSPRAGASSAIINDKVWLYGGDSPRSNKYDFYEFNMRSFTWTQIDTDISRPEVTTLLMATTTNQLVLFACSKENWILDIESSKWKKLPVSAECNFLCHQTATTGLNNDVICV